LTPGSRIYVAGASREVDLVDGFMRRLRTAGYPVAYDWTVDVRASAALGETDADLSEAARLERSGTETFAVTGCHLFWLIIPHSRVTVGAWVEMGIAMGSYRPIVVSGDWKRTIFTAQALRRFDLHEEAFAWITGDM
jgi:hypothetical protein